jgi:hypothetical protein
MSRLSRLALAFLLSCFIIMLAATPAQAASPRPGFVESWWTWVLAWGQSLIGIGPGVDPDGNDIGPGIDPLGRTLSHASGSADSGPGIDPLGGNRTTTSTGPGPADSGPAIDPNGR